MENNQNNFNNIFSMLSGKNGMDSNLMSMLSGKNGMDNNMLMQLLPQLMANNNNNQAPTPQQTPPTYPSAKELNFTLNKIYKDNL